MRFRVKKKSSDVRNTSKPKAENVRFSAFIVTEVNGNVK